MQVPDTVTIGVVLYTPNARSLGVADLERESRYAAEIATRSGVLPGKAFGQTIVRSVPQDTWRVIVSRAGMDPDTELLASVHFFAGRADPALVAGALAAFAHAWVHRREHGTEPPGSLALTDMPPGPLASARTLRDAAAQINPLMLEPSSHGDWMRAYEKLWEQGFGAN